MGAADLWAEVRDAVVIRSGLRRSASGGYPEAGLRAYILSLSKDQFSLVWRE
jgi:hypothetical protein